jgi:hypothetical protein
MPAPSINLIFARSPYQVIIDEPTQNRTKVEIRLWNKGDTKPANPTYVMSEGIVSVTQTETNYNISPFILEYIDKYFLEYSSSTITEADNKEWCIGEYITYWGNDSNLWEEIDVIEFCAVNGYSTVEQGMNFSRTTTKAYLLLANPLIKVYWNTIIPYYNFIVREKDNNYGAEWLDKAGTVLKTQTFYTGVDDFFNYAIPLVYGASVRLEITNKDTSELLVRIETEEICEPKYPIQTMWFVNKYGGWNQFAFFKASFNSIDVKNSDYSLMQKEVNYDYRKGQLKPFNINGNESIKVNSGWVTEDYFEWIQDMMLSDTILLNPSTPVVIKTMSMDKKTSLQDKNINYTLDFDFANKLINNIV